MNTRKIKNQGIVPSNSYLIHPATLLLVKQNQIKQPAKKEQNIYLIPSINFTPNEILQFYNITYITDLENTINQYPPLTIIRLLKLLLNNTNLNNLTKDKLPNIYDFLLNYFDLDTSTLNKKLNLIKKKSFDDVFF